MVKRDILHHEIRKQKLLAYKRKVKGVVATIYKMSDTHVKSHPLKFVQGKIKAKKLKRNHIIYVSFYVKGGKDRKYKWSKKQFDQM